MMNSYTSKFTTTSMDSNPWSGNVLANPVPLCRSQKITIQRLFMNKKKPTDSLKHLYLAEQTTQLMPPESCLMMPFPSVLQSPRIVLPPASSFLNISLLNIFSAVIAGRKFQSGRRAAGNSVWELKHASQSQKKTKERVWRKES